MQLLVIFCLLFVTPNNALAGGGHAHGGRSEFVNGGMPLGKIMNSLGEIKTKAHDIEELWLADNLVEIEALAISIRDISSEIAGSAVMNRSRHANFKRASKGISRAAEKLKDYAAQENALKVKQQVDRIHKYLEYAV